METLEEIDKLVEELGIEVMTPSLFNSERRRLERRFMEIHCLAPTMINLAIKDGDIQDDCDLVQEWLELMAFEPYVFPKKQRRRPPERKSDQSQQGRESGPFLFLGSRVPSGSRLYWRPWTRMRRPCFAGRGAFLETSSQG